MDTILHPNIFSRLAARGSQYLSCWPTSPRSSSSALRRCPTPFSQVVHWAKVAAMLACALAFLLPWLLDRRFDGSYVGNGTRPSAPPEPIERRLDHLEAFFVLDGLGGEMVPWNVDIFGEPRAGYGCSQVRLTRSERPFLFHSVAMRCCSSSSG